MVLTCQSVHAQELSFKEIDRISYELYEQKKWEELVQFGDRKDVCETDYIFLHLRLGIAHFNLRNWYRSEKYFLSVLDKNDQQKTAFVYLRDIATILNYPLAKEKYSMTLGESDYERPGSVSIYAEGGVKWSFSEVETNEPYVMAAYAHRVRAGWRVNGILSYISQDGERVKYQQYELGLISRNAVGKTGVLSIGGRYIHKNQRTTGVNYDASYQTSENIPIFPGIRIDSIVDISGKFTNEIDLSAFAVFGGFTKRIGRLSAGINGYYHFQNRVSTGTDSYSVYWNERIYFFDALLLERNGNFQNEDIISQSEKPDQFQVGVSLSYNLPIWRDRMIISLDGYSTPEAMERYTLIPSLWIKTTKNSSLFLEYFQKDTDPLLFRKGAFYLNRNIRYPVRLTAIFSYNMSKNTSLFFTYIYEEKGYFSNGPTRFFNSTIIGLNLTL
jgi:hypothetical protein